MSTIGMCSNQQAAYFGKLGLITFLYRITSTYFFPFKEDLMRFDFELDPEDEHMYNFPIPILG